MIIVGSVLLGIVLLTIGTVISIMISDDYRNWQNDDWED